MSRHEEDGIQIASATFLDLALAPPAHWHHAPNGGKRNEREAARLKRQGVKPGVADILVFAPERLCEQTVLRGFAIELKTDVGTLSKEQEAWARAWIRSGGRYAIGRSCYDVETALRHWGVKLRATQLREGQPLIVERPDDVPPPGRLLFTNALIEKLAPRAAT